MSARLIIVGTDEMILACFKVTGGTVCIIFTIVQHTWNSMQIMIAIEVLQVLITAGTGVIERIIEMACDNLSGFMR